MELIKFDRDKNGNGTIKIKLKREKRSFSIQTNGNLPNCHELRKMRSVKSLKNICKVDENIIKNEVKQYLKRIKRL